MKTITISGIIKTEYDDFARIFLVQEDGLKIDLINRFEECIMSFGDSGVQVNYYLSDKICTKDEMLEGWLKTICGDVEAEYETCHYNYSSWTSGTDYNAILTIGGHNLSNELWNEEDKFVLIELNFKQ